MPLIADYMTAWKAHDVDGVLSCLHEQCEVIECYGPIYRGHATVALWMRKWCETGRVLNWDVTRQWLFDTFEAVEWRFECMVDGERSAFEGASVVEIAQGKIRYLREFATTAPLYEWQGEWRRSISRSD